MNHIVKQALALSIFLIIVATLNFVVWPRLQNTPTKTVVTFLAAARTQNLPELQSVLAAPEVALLTDHPEALALLELPQQWVPTAEVNLTATVVKVDGTSENGLVSFTVTDEDGWKVVLGLPKKFRIQQLKANLTDPNLADRERLTNLEELQELDPLPEQATAIDDLKKEITNDEVKEAYKSQIKIHLQGVEKNFLIGIIGNFGDRDLDVVKGNLQFAQENGEIIEEHEVTIYERIPGSTVFGEAIPAHYQKKFGLDLTNLVMPPRAVVTFDVTDLTFAHEK